MHNSNTYTLPPLPALCSNMQARAGYFVITLIFLSTMLSSSIAVGTSYRISHKENNEFWGIGTSIMQYQLESDDDFSNNIEGPALMLSFSRGAFRGSWAYEYGADFTTGPYQKSFDGGLNMDSIGFGINSQIHYLIGAQNLRAKGVKFVITGGGSASFLDGNSVGNNQNLSQNFNSTENDNLINSYEIRKADFSILIGPKVLFLKDARPMGNVPHLLKSRVEGYSIGLLGYIPIANYYEANQTILQKATDKNINVESVYEFSGSLTGFSVLLAFTTFISG
jgi:hypothetical protein